MSIDSLSVWKSTLAALPKVEDSSWSLSFASWYTSRIVNITTNPSSLVPLGFSSTFATTVFKDALAALGPSSSAAAGIAGFAGAWEDALNATVIVVGPGSFAPPTSPPTMFSLVTTTTITPASIAAGKAKILELVTAPLVSDPNDSLFPQKFRDATLLLKITIVGLDSQPPPAAGPGPQSLTISNVPLI